MQNIKIAVNEAFEALDNRRPYDKCLPNGGRVVVIEKTENDSFPEDDGSIPNAPFRDAAMEEVEKIVRDGGTAIVSREVPHSTGKPRICVARKI